MNDKFKQIFKNEKLSSKELDYQKQLNDSNIAVKRFIHRWI